MKLKICGMKERENILKAAQLQPDFMGFIFWKKSSRFFSGTIPELPSSIEKTGVFVDAAFGEIMKTAENHQLGHIQLHGSETPEMAGKLRDEGLKVIKAFGIGRDFNPGILKSFEATADYFLFDAKGKLPGGNGFAFNWDLLEKMQTTTPIFLSGGIGPDDAAKLKELGNKIYAADVNSRFEDRPGFKNIALLQQFKDDYYGL